MYVARFASDFMSGNLFPCCILYTNYSIIVVDASIRLQPSFVSVRIISRYTYTCVPYGVRQPFWATIESP